MASTYHTKIRDIVAEYGNNQNNIGHVYKEKENPIAIPHPTPQAQRIPIYYDPDVYYIKSRNNKYVIFEIVDKQSITETIADVIEVYLCPFEISTLFFITPTDYKRKKHENASKIILAILRRRLSVNKPPIEVRVVKIPERKRYVKRHIFNILDREVRDAM